MNVTRPESPQFFRDHIPSELRDLHQWVCWCYEWVADKKKPDGGKWTKVPKSPTARRKSASSTKSETWGSLDEAVDAAERHAYDGVGFVFTDDDSYIGIDLDDCIDSLGALRADAREVVDQLDTYTELTPSGNGLHLIVSSDEPLPGKGKCDKPAGREMYESGRYFTFTGQVFETPNAVRHVDDEANDFYRKWFSPTKDKPARNVKREGGMTGSLNELSIKPMYLELLLTGEGREGNRSDDAFSFAMHCLHQGIAEDTIVELLINPDHYLASAALERRHGEEESAADWVRQYVVSPAAEKVAESKSPDAIVPRMGRAPWEHFPDRYEKETDEGEIQIKGIKATIENLEYLLYAYRVELRSNVFTKQPAADFPWKQYRGKGDGEADDIISEIRSIAERTGMPAKNIQENLGTIARRRPDNPVVDYLKQLQWDGQDYIQKLCDAIVVAPIHIKARDIAVRRWLIQAAAAADGADSTPRGDALPKYEYVLVMVADQGVGKTKWMMQLLPPALSSYFKSGVSIDPSDKDSVIKATGSWIVELGELDATFRRADVARLKAFLSEDIDEYRIPYGRAPSRWKRRTVFGGTVNDTEFLSDATGNRRYMAIQVDELHDHGLDIDQLWAQVWQLYTGGEQWWPTSEEEAWLDGSRIEFDSNVDHPVISAVIEAFGPFEPQRVVKTRRWTMSEILNQAGVSRPTHADMTRLSNWMQTNHRGEGGARMYARIKGTKRWYMPPPHDVWSNTPLLGR